MICNISKEYFTEENMIEFWIKNHLKADSSDFLISFEKTGQKKTGMFFSGKNSIVILKDGLKHNLIGPAFITMYTYLKRPAGRDYYTNGERLPEDSFKRKILTAKSKKDTTKLKDIE